MANVDLEYGRVPNEEVDEPAFQTLLRRVKSGKKSVEKRPSICTVPSVLRNLSQKSFTPRVVSIGPLHKESKNLQESEGLKDSYLHDLLSRSHPSRTLEEQLKECLEAVNHMMKDIRSCYDDVVMNKKYKDTDLANMMVLDGGFILEFCYKLQDNKEATMLSKIQISCIAIDLMLLENQIPFFVLEAIFNRTTHPKNISLTCLVRKILGSYIHPFSFSLEKEVSDDDSVDSSQHVHVLDCVHKIYKIKPSSETVVNIKCQTSEKDGDCETSLNYNHSVVELDRSGVNFKPHKQNEMSMAMNVIKSRSCYHLSPWSKRTLVMPTLVIQEFTEVILRNFIAYEQFSPKVNYYFTSYASAMDMLIDCEADVGKLVESKVIVNNLGSNKEVARVINGICVNIEIERFCYSEAIKELDKYYNSYWPKHFAYFKRTYFNNPWSVIAFFAGFIVFGLAVLQAVLRIIDR
uniref:putative UPF0481 protein At3g02645 n=1 Tax=Erigeron canadensis TaxID=72917 RepID=UPI001CB8FEAF|nr:putative UPF0481 protein At3g02645 [Erigeron canadensis]